MDCSSLALADVGGIGIKEWRLRTRHITQPHIAWSELVRTHYRWGMAEGSTHCLPSVVHAEERDHVVLIDTIAGHADRTDQRLATIDRHRTRKDLDTVGEQYGRRLVVNTTRYEGNGVDDKLQKLTADTGGTLVTTDYNLAKVAEVQELKVMNLSELVIALRPEVQPGDPLQLKIVRDGKEADQGVGYLEDGTMVVVEGGKGRSGERIAVTVTGALQTPTGRMVFARSDQETPPRRGNRAKSEPNRPEGPEHDATNPR